MNVCVACMRAPRKGRKEICDKCSHLLRMKVGHTIRDGHTHPAVHGETTPFWTRMLAPGNIPCYAGLIPQSMYTDCCGGVQNCRRHRLLIIYRLITPRAGGCIGDITLYAAFRNVFRHDCCTKVVGVLRASRRRAEMIDSVPYIHLSDPAVAYISQLKSIMPFRTGDRGMRESIRRIKAVFTLYTRKYRYLRGYIPTDIAKRLLSAAEDYCATMPRV